MTQQKTCTDCVHYKQHYIVRNKKPRPIDCGHCMSRHRNGKARKTDKLCEKFVDKEKS